MLQGTAEDTLLTRWYDSTAVYNIGLIKTVLDSADVPLWRTPIVIGVRQRGNMHFLMIGRNKY